MNKSQWYRQCSIFIHYISTNLIFVLFGTIMIMMMSAQDFGCFPLEEPVEPTTTRIHRNVKQAIQ